MLAGASSIELETEANYEPQTLCKSHVLYADEVNHYATLQPPVIQEAKKKTIVRTTYPVRLSSLTPVRMTSPLFECCQVRQNKVLPKFISRKSSRGAKDIALGNAAQLKSICHNYLKSNRANISPPDDAETCQGSLHNQVVSTSSESMDAQEVPSRLPVVDQKTKNHLSPPVPDINLPLPDSDTPVTTTCGKGAPKFYRKNEHQKIIEGPQRVLYKTLQGDDMSHECKTIVVRRKQFHGSVSCHVINREIMRNGEHSVAPHGTFVNRPPSYGAPGVLVMPKCIQDAPLRTPRSPIK